MAELLDTGNSEEQEIALSIFLMLCSQRLEYCQLVLDEGFAVIPALVSAMELLRLLKDVNVVEDQQDYSSGTDPDQARPRDHGDHHKENKRSSSSRSSGLFSIFSRPKRALDRTRNTAVVSELLLLNLWDLMRIPGSVGFEVLL
ncbi:hypothetical protein CRG98_009633 [Punica granatum]|uniref:Uncharacterized protein n=1 Tax=Punica granatum TaxID=22663 RepID=A0A2I0KNX6_PUNGR|nr:hypothetical protein CRG98_009633 [Punica granatum]